MDTNMNKSFSTERGFFRDADTGAGGGGGGVGGVGGGAKDDENINDENKNDEKKDEQTSDKESNIDILSQLKKNLKDIEKLIRGYEFSAAVNLVKLTRELVNNYQPQSEEEKAGLLFFTDRLNLKAKALNIDEEEVEINGSYSARNYEPRTNQQQPVEVDEKDAVNQGLQPPEFASDSEIDKQKLLDEINYTWSQELNTVFRHSQISGNPELYSNHVQPIKEKIIQIYGKDSPLAKLFDLSINIRDLSFANAGETKHLCINNVAELLRALKASKLTKDDVQDFKKLTIFEEESGAKHSVKEVFDFICNDLIFVQDQKGYEWQGKKYNFAKDGDREGVLEKIVREKFPFLNELPKFVFDSILNMVIIQGPRYDAFAPYYTYYQASPIFGMNAEWFSSTNPLISILYSIGSSPPIPGGKTLLQVVRLPAPEHYKDQNGNQLPVINLSPNNGLDSNDDAYAGEYSKRKRFTKYTEAMELRDYNTDVADPIKREENKTRMSKAIHAWRTLVNVRNSLCELVSPTVDIGYVTINPDYKFLPSLHDVYESRWIRQNHRLPDSSNSTIKPWTYQEHSLKDLSVQDYIEIQERFKEFLDLVDKPPQLSDRLSLGAELKKAYSATSKYKAIFSTLGITKDIQETHPFYDFLQIVRLMYVVYIKKLFNQYIQLPSTPGWAIFERVNKEFLRVVRDSLEHEAGTLPEAIARYLLDEVIIPAQSGRGSYSVAFDNTGNIEPWVMTKMKQGSRYAQLFQRWVKEPTAAEKNPNKE